MSTEYPIEELGPDDDDGTMPDNVEKLAEAVVGHRIAKAEYETLPGRWYGETKAFVLTLDTGRRVILRDTDDCCAHTSLEAFLLSPEKVDHAIMGVGTTSGYEKWHIYADMGDVLELSVGWSCGNPFYYGYGFDITVEDIEQEHTVTLTKEKAWVIFRADNLGQIEGKQAIDAMDIEEFEAYEAFAEDFEMEIAQIGVEAQNEAAKIMENNPVTVGGLEAVKRHNWTANDYADLVDLFAGSRFETLHLSAMFGVPNNELLLELVKP